MTQEDKNPIEVKVLAEVLSALGTLDEDSRERVIRTAATFYSIAQPGASHPERSVAAPQHPQFSYERMMSSKEFMLQKMPKTDIERVACLAYYLTHYKDMPNFKTLDISQLNTEAAQPKFANAAYSVENAVKMGYLVPAVKGLKQLSAAGEVFVRALPDREGARAAMAGFRPRKRGKRLGAQQVELTELDNGAETQP